MDLNEPAYLFKNIRTDGILPHVFLGKAMVHLLCKRGSMSFYFAGQRVVAQEGCLVLWQMRSNIQQVQYSPDFDADYFIITRSFMLQFNPDAQWASLGFTYIKMHPVFPLLEGEYALMQKDFDDIRMRMSTEHPFKNNLVRNLLQVFMYDMWSIYSREFHKLSLNTTANLHFNRFLELVQEHCRENRTVAYYSEKLFISSPYLLQICQQVSDRSASDWIAYYTVQEIVSRLSNPELSISQISDELSFSSVSHFSHYVKKHLGVSPQEFRK